MEAGLHYPGLATIDPWQDGVGKIPGACTDCFIMARTDEQYRSIQFLCVIIVLATSLFGETVGSQDPPVTTVAGESWLNHLNRAFSDTSMGKTGRLGPAPTQPEDARYYPLASPGVNTHAVILHGSDLYRLNCRGCHGESGLGAPPEINSVINPVRSTSVAIILQQMKNRGMEIGQNDAAELARQSKASLMQRLHHGGQDMPPFPHLSEAEIRSLFAYLKQIAGVPGAESEQATVRESPVRVGEHLVKSTCHTCHSAAGPNPNPQQLLDGAIPPLNTLTTRLSLPDFVRKVTNGAPIFMGSPPLLCRGRMPVFYYLSQDEAADVYLYLSLYPPYAQGQTAGKVERIQTVVSPSSVPYTEPREGLQPRKGVISTMGTLRLVVIFLLLAGGLGFTVFEFRRLSVQSKGRELAAECESSASREARMDKGA